MVRSGSLLDRERQTEGKFTRSDFVYERDVHGCPSGHDLRTTNVVIPVQLKHYRAKPTACGPSALKPGCTDSFAPMANRNVPGDEREHTPLSRQHSQVQARYTWAPQG